MNRMILCIFGAIIITACNNSTKQTEAKAAPPALSIRTGMAISEDTARLAQLIDLKKYPTTGAVFKWNGQTTEGLEAVLFYDEKTYAAILTAYMNAGFPKGNYSREQFDFPWLDSAQHAELHFSKPDYKGTPDIFLGTRDKGMLWFLDKKVLLKIQP
ncbi:hypothetical protein A8C56_14800 [Niabella ginsenosidivorans]|uniref:Uncharacterized protein n=1 Tax=Niabella ginsenosidivorans TaxID=1176587 RepID=A0A1A9I5Y7_9BACT|nr:hypothetical protein [Niabella ginsenosidivorans]ANH82072.1 hypothetical protein A8C56_14800 [Niabella ginsenosidivorans]